MRKIFIAFAVAATLAACSNKKTETVTSENALADTSTHNSLTDQPQVIKMEGVNDTTVTTTTTVVIHKDPVVVSKQPVSKPKKTVTKTNTVKAPSSTGNGNETASQPAPTTQKKKGWSSAAKGTAIGAGSGAVLGAIVSKKKGKGAIIGGVVGAAGGYIIGNEVDKKSGRKKKN